jgi:precorrin-6B methylase 2
MESRFDTRNAELVRGLTTEIEKSLAASHRTFDASNERVQSMMKQLGDRLDSKNGEIIENFNQLQKEVQAMQNRTGELERTGNERHQKVLDLLV